MIQGLKDTTRKTLAWSEQYTKTDMTYLAKGGFWLTFGYGIQMISGLVLAVALANLLPKESYGTYQFIISTSAIISALTLSGMGTALMRTTAQGTEGALLTAVKTQLLWSLGIVFSGVALSLYYFVNDNTLLSISFLIVGACAPFLSAFSLYRPYLEGKQLFKDSVVLGAWRRPIPVVAMLIALFLTNDVATLIAVYFLSHSLSMGLMIWKTLRAYPERSAPQKEMVAYSKHLSVMNIFGVLANNLDSLLVFHFLGAAPTAVYALSQLPQTHFLKLFGLAGSLMFPKLAKRDINTLKHSLFHKLCLYFLVATAVVIAYILSAPFLFSLLFPSYPEAILFSQLLILTLLAKPFTLYTQTFAAHGMKNVQYFVQISVSVIKVLLVVLLVPLYGVWGAVMSVLITAVYWSIAVTALFYSLKVPR